CWTVWAREISCWLTAPTTPTLCVRRSRNAAPGRASNQCPDASTLRLSVPFFIVTETSSSASSTNSSTSAPSPRDTKNTPTTTSHSSSSLPSEYGCDLMSLCLRQALSRSGRRLKINPLQHEGGQDAETPAGSKQDRDRAPGPRWQCLWLDRGGDDLLPDSGPLRRGRLQRHRHSRFLLRLGARQLRWRIGRNYRQVAAAAPPAGRCGHHDEGWNAGGAQGSLRRQYNGGRRGLAEAPGHRLHRCLFRPCR